MQLGELEVVWPLHRWHYLSPALVDEGLVMHTEPVSADAPRPCLDVETTHDRDLAARALLADPDCSRERVSELLGVSRRTLGRRADGDFTTTLRDAQALEATRTCFEGTASRGSTTAERAAASAWLQEAARSEHQFTEPAEAAPPSRRVPSFRRRRGLPALAVASSMKSRFS